MGCRTDAAGLSPRLLAGTIPHSSYGVHRCDLDEHTVVVAGSAPRRGQGVQDLSLRLPARPAALVPVADDTKQTSSNDSRVGWQPVPVDVGAATVRHLGGRQKISEQRESLARPGRGRHDDAVPA